MKKYLATLFVGVCSLFGTFQSFASSNESEFIRLKIENRDYTAIHSFGIKLRTQETTAKFYRARGFSLAWTKPSRDILINTLKACTSEGLSEEDYHLRGLEKALTINSPSSDQKADLDLLLTDAFLIYSSHMLSGKVNPVTVDAEWKVNRREGNPLELIQKGTETGDFMSIFRLLNAEHPEYEQLKKALSNYSKLRDVEWQEIQGGPTIKMNMKDERLNSIRKRLELLGDLSSGKTQQTELLDSSLANAVKSFQLRHGLDPDGNIGAQTLANLNVSPKIRIEQIRVNLERLRWLPRDYGDYYLMVRITKFELEIVRNNKIIRRHKIIVGKPARKTPVFSAQVQYLVFNPTWTVPPTILNADVIPGIRKDPSYLEKKKLTVLDKSGKALNTNDIDWSSDAVRGYTYRQSAGSENALGAVKFIFPNDYHIYLHDTPAKELFAQNERAFSSGCIRVESPIALAEFLLNDPVNWNAAKINSVVQGNTTQTVNLKEKPQVHMRYSTAWVDAEGTLQFRKDIYKRDGKVLLELDRIVAP